MARASRPCEAVQQKDKSVMAGRPCHENDNDTHPGRGCRSSPRARCRGAYVLLHIPVVHFRSLPAKLPAPFQGAQAQLEKYVTVFMKSCS